MQFEVNTNALIVQRVIAVKYQTDPCSVHDKTLVVFSKSGVHI